MSGSVAEMTSSQADIWIQSSVWGMNCICGTKLSTWLGVSRDKASRHLVSCVKLKESLPEDHMGVAEAIPETFLTRRRDLERGGGTRRREMCGGGI